MQSLTQQDFNKSHPHRRQTLAELMIEHGIGVAEEHLIVLRRLTAITLMRAKVN